MPLTQLVIRLLLLNSNNSRPALFLLDLIFFFLFDNFKYSHIYPAGMIGLSKVRAV